MDTKIYEPEVVAENPFPGEPLILGSESSTKSNDVYSPAITKPKAFKQKNVSHETIASALNTRSRKILQEFDLVQSGGFKVGNFEEGISGDLRITPGGLTARNISGDTTFAIDGDTGDAFFRGEVRAADFVVVDENGLISLSAFYSDSVTSSTSQEITGDFVFQDITNLSHTISLSRETRVLLFAVIPWSMTGYDTNPYFRISYGSSYFPSESGWLGGEAEVDAFFSSVFSFTQIITLPAGDNIVKLQAARGTIDETLYVCYNGNYSATFGYLTLGR